VNKINIVACKDLVVVVHTQLDSSFVDLLVVVRTFVDLLVVRTFVEEVVSTLPVALRTSFVAVLQLPAARKLPVVAVRLHFVSLFLSLL